MNVCGQPVEKNDMVLSYLERDPFNYFEKTGIWSLCKMEDSRTVYKLPLKIIEINR